MIKAHLKFKILNKRTGFSQFYLYFQYMKIWLTGANGQLGKEFQLLAKNSKFEWQFSNSTDCDITNFNLVESKLNEYEPNIIINCAAYTKVDLAEEEQEKCYLTNTKAVENLAKLCKKNNIALIHFSTDYVFDGSSESAYTENDKTNPLSVYGKSKQLGEEKILAIQPKGIVFRTSWVYSQFGHNFLKIMLRLGKEKEKLTVVNDQISTPTHAKDLAKAVLTCIEKGISENEIELIHFSNSGTASWYDFAKYIMKEASLNCEVSPIPTSEYPLPAPRPKFSLLSIDKFVKNVGYSPPYWKDAVKNCIKLLNKETQC